MGAKIVVATHNKKKLVELERILREHMPDMPADTLITAGDLDLVDVVENGVTFEENALIKARAAAAESGLIAVADDSGIAVDILGGSPGIFSARWSGRHGDDDANRHLLLAQVSDISSDHRKASYVCAAALVTPEGEEFVLRAEMGGRLAHTERGTNGFGYDSIFIPDDQECPGTAPLTAAQMTAEQKDAISHRGKAFRALAPKLVALLQAK